MAENRRKKPPLILVVDDEWMNREMMQAYLEGEGYEVMLAHNGEKALEMAAARPPDLILMDVRMPGMSGYEVCKRFKASEATCYTPVLMVTAMDRDEDKRRALEAGADDLVGKPLDSLVMLNRIRSLIRLKYLYDERRERNASLHAILKHYVDDKTADSIMAAVEHSPVADE